jgi:hypothetical protein
MSKPVTPQDLERAKAMIKREQKAMLKKQMAMIKSIKETQDHDRKTCICEGCHNYALVGTITQNGRLYTVVQEWDEIRPEEYLRSMQQFLQYKMDKKTSPEFLIKKLVEKGIPEKQAEVLVNQMLAPVHVVFFRPPPMGLMKEI